jgi:hypothetical protein
MNSKYLALAAIGTQMILGLILILILLSIQGQGKTSVFPCYQSDGKGGFAYSPICTSQP